LERQIKQKIFGSKKTNISGVMVTMLVSSVLDCIFEFWSGQTKDYKIDICCFFTKHTALKRKRQDWLAWN
jgi:predicted transcriptional regulator of viral defense system